MPREEGFQLLFYCFATIISRSMFFFKIAVVVRGSCSLLLLPYRTTTRYVWIVKKSICECSSFLSNLSIKTPFLDY
jgi:hypothetical protein